MRLILCGGAGFPVAIAYTLRKRRDTLYDKDGVVIPQPLDILFAIYQSGAYWYEAVGMPVVCVCSDTRR